MGPNVVFRQEIANVLRATACASEGSARMALELIASSAPEPIGDPEQQLQAYRQGVRHALVSVGLAFGLEPVGAGAQPRPGASSSLAGLLWAEAPPES